MKIVHVQNCAKPRNKVHAAKCVPLHGSPRPLCGKKAKYGFNRVHRVIAVTCEKCIDILARES